MFARINKPFNRSLLILGITTVTSQVTQAAADDQSLHGRAMSWPNLCRFRLILPNWDSVEHFPDPARWFTGGAQDHFDHPMFGAESVVP
jgi:hypothetical protein